MMPRPSHWAAASLLATAISLAGCGEEPTSSTPATVQQPESSQATAPVLTTARLQPVAVHYANLALVTFQDALETSKALNQTIDALLAAPSEETLQAAKEAWILARKPYMQSEVFRFGNPVVDDWEGQVNAWPLDEGLIDYVAQDYQHALGNPGAQANIIANTQLQIGEELLDVSDINGELLAELNELAGSEANVATGYHAIEFLLWGQDLNGTGPGAGQRPSSDFLLGEACTGGHCERRRQYLKTVTELLIKDLEYMVGQWQPDVADNYRAELLAEPMENVLRKMLFGMGSLSLGELAGERMKVSLEANSTEDEHDCFSDNTHNSHFYNAKGIRNIYLGQYQRTDGTLISGPSLSMLVQGLDPKLDESMRANLATTEAQLQALVHSAEKGQAFDQLIAAENTEGQLLVRKAIAALVQQTTAIEQLALALDLQDLNPDTADHSF